MANCNNLSCHGRFFCFFKGTSIAFWLARSSIGQALLVRGSLITPATLNHVIIGEKFTDLSVSELLSSAPEGRSLFQYNNYLLGKLIINRSMRAPDFDLPDDIQPYFQDPKLLRQFLQSMPGRRNEIITEASEHVARLRSISRLASTCKTLRLYYLNPKEKYNPSNQIEGCDPLDALDNWEKCTSIRLSSLCLFGQKSDSNTRPYSVKSSISHQSNSTTPRPKIMP